MGAIGHVRLVVVEDGWGGLWMKDFVRAKVAAQRCVGGFLIPVMNRRLFRMQIID